MAAKLQIITGGCTAVKLFAVHRTDIINIDGIAFLCRTVYLDKRIFQCISYGIIYVLIGNLFYLLGQLQALVLAKLYHLVQIDILCQI